MLTTAIVGLPLVAGVLMAVAWRYLRPQTARRIVVVATGLTVLCAVPLLFVEAGPAVTVEWLPGTGRMGVSTGPSGLYVVLVTTLGGFLVLLGAAPLGICFGPLSGAIMLLALAGANAAFLADHFLARYVGLEIVALCVALAPLVEVRDRAGTRLAWSSYLLLRVGDAGLLVAILILADLGGTLSIDPALERALSSMEGTGSALNEARVGWMVAGFVLAAWVKMGGWPFHLWGRPGRRFSLASQVWLYATVVPNLGAYLLYRVTPLLALAGPLQRATLWLGAGGAALAALLALTQTNPRAALVYIGAAQSGLALFVAAAGVRPAVWVGLLVLTPLRLLLFLGADAVRVGGVVMWRRINIWLFGLAGSALAAFSLLTTWWAREAGAPLDALLIAQTSAGLTAVWTAQTAWRLYKALPGTSSRTKLPWTQTVVVGVLGGGVLAGGLGFGPLLRYLAASGNLIVPNLPSIPGLLRYVASAPGLLAVLALSLATWRLQRRSGRRLLVAGESGEEGYDLQEGLARAAQVLHAVVEVGIAERIIALIVRVVVDGARVAWAVEHRGLEGVINRSARAVVNGAHVAHRIVEQRGLEGILRGAVRTVMALSRALQRWHTGRMRRNLLWVPIALALAVLTLVALGR